MRFLWALMLFAFTASATEEAEWMDFDPLSVSEEWQLILSEQEGKELVKASFREERSNRLRRRPSSYEGDLIFSKEYGLSLRYAAAIASVVVLDEEGVLRRSIEGERKLPMSEETGGLPRLILQLFQLDLAALKESFEIEGRLSADEWALRFIPFGEVGDTLGVKMVTLIGSDDWVREIHFDRTGGMKLRIELTEHEKLASLPEVERVERFR